MNNLRPVQLQCNTCGTPGVKPKLRKHQTVTHVVTEAIWACHRCGTYFKRGVVNQEVLPSAEK